MSSSSSIWNENPTVYLLIRRILFIALTAGYPLVFYAILWKSPKSFGSLKWFLLFQLSSITTQWVCGLLLIDLYTFVPSKITRVNGVLMAWIDPRILYRAMYFVNSVASASCLLLFWNRIFSILSMYQGPKSKLRLMFELVLYMITFLLSTYIVIGLQIPEQSAVKKATKLVSPYYPDCLDEPNVVVLVVPYPEAMKKMTLFYVFYLFLMFLVTFLSAQIAYRLLSRRMQNQSERTKRMHRKFNRRTFLQVIIDTLFSSIPFSISNLATLFGWNLPELTYLVDVLSKNNPTACIVVLFLYYEPYQKWLKATFHRILCRVENVSFITIVSIKSIEN